MSSQRLTSLQQNPPVPDRQSLSFVSGPTKPSLWNKTLGRVINDQADKYEARSATLFLWQNVQLSYRDLATQSEMMTKAMLSRGLQHGDRVAIMAGNCFQYLVAFLAAARLGCPYVVLNNTYSPQELFNALSSTTCKAIFLAGSIGLKSLCKHFDFINNSADLPHLRQIIMLGGSRSSNKSTRAILSYDQFLSAASHVSRTELEQAERRVKPDDILNLQFTSGTTGSPKAAMLTHNNLLNNGNFVGAAMHLTSRDIVACPPPLFHCFGLVMGFLASFTHGSRIVFPSDQFNAEQALDAVFKAKCTALLGVPTMFVAILEANKRKNYTITTVRTGLAAGASVSAVLMKQLHDHLRIKGMLIAYGMTETSPVTFITSLGDTEERKTTTVGHVLPHTAAKVIDTHGSILPRGQRGELCTSGYALQKGYWQNQAKTDEVMETDQNGVLWMHTGDECVIDECGYCMVTGRIKDIIIRGGENIFPLEIEERLLQHPDVSEASVVAIKDAKYGEVVGAFLKRVSKETTTPTSDEMVAWTRQTLGSHKSPNYCFWIGDAGVGDDFPKTGSGKYQKHLLRAIGDRLVVGGHPAVIARGTSKL